jgi:hypothetical protein
MIAQPTSPNSGIFSQQWFLTLVHTQIQLFSHSRHSWSLPFPCHCTTAIKRLYLLHVMLLLICLAQLIIINLKLAMANQTRNVCFRQHINFISINQLGLLMLQTHTVQWWCHPSLPLCPQHIAMSLFMDTLAWQYHTFQIMGTDH